MPFHWLDSTAITIYVYALETVKMAKENEESQVNFQKLIVVRGLTVLVQTWENVQKQIKVWFLRDTFGLVC